MGDTDSKLAPLVDELSEMRRHLGVIWQPEVYDPEVRATTSTPAAGWAPSGWGRVLQGASSQRSLRERLARLAQSLFRGAAR